MYLSKLQLWNFRKFGSNNEIIVDKKLREPDLEISFTKGLNVLIGENDSGKTAIIDSIKLILKTHSFEWIGLENEDFYENTKTLRIECRFDDLSSEEAKNFIEWLGVEGEGEEAIVYLRVILEAQISNERIFLDIKAGVDNEGHALTVEAREYLKTVYLKPLRDAEGELVPKRNSRLSQILRGHETFKGKNDDHELVEIFQKFSGSIENYFSDDTKDGNKINKQIEIFLAKFFGEKKKSKFTFSEKKLKNILETLKLILEDGKLGLGSHNLLFIASELLNLKRKNWYGVRIGLIEELEAHLHPQVQMRVIETLQQEKDVQFILTTHSPNLASKVKLKNLIICTDDSSNNANAFPMGSRHTELKKNYYKFLEKFLDVTKANIFFAKGVILVEGWTEEILLPAFAKIIRINLTEKGVSIVNIGSTAFLKYAKIFQRKNKPFMNIPVSVITDIDIKPEDEDDDLETRIIEKEKKYTYQAVKGFVSPRWTLEYCLYKSSLGKKFQEIVKSVHPKTDFSNFYEKLYEKLSNKSLNKTEIAYQLAQALEEDAEKEKPEVSVDQDDEYIKYLINAIKYATNGN